MTTLDYRIQPVQIPVHGLKESGLLTEPKGYELFRRDGIKLVSMGIFPSEIAAKNSAVRHADPDRARFV
jgi:hypothetical protein